LVRLQITKAVVLLMKLRDALNDGKDTSDMSRQFSSCIHMRETTTINDKRTLSMFVDIVQVSIIYHLVVFLY